MPRLDFDDPKGLYEPIEIKLKGNVYTLKKITKTLYEKILELETSKEKYAGIEQLKVAFGIPKSAFDGMDIREINAAVQLLTNVVTKHEDYLTEEAKKVLRLGDKT